MLTNNDYSFRPLNEPTPISQQNWPVGTTPLLSTSTLTYNHGEYIRDCIEGILMQKTTFPVRVVIFDDFSLDETRSIIKEYETKYPNLIYVIYSSKNTYKKPERKKALEPRNKIRNVAKYIAICEGDDYWTDPLKLQKQVEALESHPEINICVHPSEILEKGNITIKYCYWGQLAKILTPKEVIDLYISGGMQSIVIRNKDLDEYSKIIQSPALGAHSALLIFFGLPYGMLYLPEPMAVYRKNSNSSVSKVLFKKDRNYLNRMLDNLVTLERIDKHFEYKFTHQIKKTKRKRVFYIISQVDVKFKMFMKLTITYGLFLNPITFFRYILETYIRGIK